MIARRRTLPLMRPLTVLNRTLPLQTAVAFFVWSRQTVLRDRSRPLQVAGRFYGILPSGAAVFGRPTG